MECCIDSRRRAVVVFVGLCCLALLLFADTSSAGQAVGSGNIIGQVVDESGAVLPGVTVTATGPVRQATAVTDVRGEYRLASLPIGTYRLEYALPGFQTVIREDTRVSLDFTARLDVELTVGALQESVTVEGAAPVVDVTSTGARTQIQREALQTLPRGADGYVGLMQQTPGVRPNLDVGGSSASFPPQFVAFGMTGESNQALDGVSTANPAHGAQSGNYVDYSSFEEATVQAMGHDASSLNRGVTINAVVKSGTNSFGGGAAYGGTNDRFQSDNLTDELRADGVTSGRSIPLRDDVSGELGGPIVRDRLFFYLSSRQRRDKETRPECFQDDGTTPCFEGQDSIFLTNKNTLQISSKHRLNTLAQVNWRDNIRGASRTTAWEARRQQFGFDGAYKVEWEGVLTNSVMAVFHVGRWWNNSGSDGNANGRPAATDAILGTRWGTNDEAGERNNQERWHGKGQISWYKSNWLRGNHEFKTGFDTFVSHANRLRNFTGEPNYELRFSSGVGDRLIAHNAPVLPEDSVRYLGTYVQDSWTIARSLTLNLGVRYAYDTGRLPEQCRDAAQAPGNVAYPARCFDAVVYPDWHSVSPRARAAYDITGDGKNVIKGGWGRYQRQRYNTDLIPTQRNAIGSTTYLWRDLNGNKDYDPGEVDLDPINGRDYLSSTVSSTGILNPDWEQTYTDEYLVQFERELRPNFGVRVTGMVARVLNERVIENTLRPYEVYNIPITRPDPGPDAVLGNADDPGTSLTYWDYPTQLRGQNFERPWVINDPSANQTYKTIEVVFDRRYRNGWQFMSSFSATKTDNPKPGGTGGAGFGAFTLNPNSEINAADKTWDWLGRSSASYLFPWGVLFAGNYELRSGAVWSRTVQVRGGTSIPQFNVRVDPLGTNRYPNINLLDLRAEKRFTLARGHMLRAQVNVYNALNISTVLGQTTQSGPNFGTVTSIFLPRIFDFRVAYTF